MSIEEELKETIGLLEEKIEVYERALQSKSWRPKKVSAEEAPKRTRYPLSFLWPVAVTLSLLLFVTTSQ